MASLNPELVDIYPTRYDSPIADLQPEITLGWSVDMPTAQFSDAEELPSRISMTKLTTGVQVELEYVSYTASTRTLKVQPTEALDSGTSYQVIVHNNCRDEYGRRLLIDVTWVFYTAGSAVGQTVLVSPADYSVQSTFPGFSWTDEGYSYQFELDNEPTFTSPLETATVTGGTYTPSTSYPTDVAYYWRVRAISDTGTAVASGDWSDVRSFYHGISTPAHPSSRTQFSNTLVMTGWGFSDGYTNVSSWPDLEFYFNTTIANAATGYVTVTKQYVSPRNDLSYSYAASGVAGDWSISSSTLIFTPSEAIESNMRYEIKLKAGLPSTEGYTLEKTQKFYVTGPYTPYYCHINHVKAMLGREAYMVDDDLINFLIHMQSLEANAVYWTALAPISGIGPEGISESEVRDPTLMSHAVMRWVTATTAYMVLKRALNDELRNLGRTVRLADYSERLDQDFLDGIEQAMKNAKEEAEKWAGELIGVTNSKMVSPVSGWSRYNWLADRFVGGVEFWHGEIYDLGG